MLFQVRFCFCIHTRLAVLFHSEYVVRIDFHTSNADYVVDPRLCPTYMGLLYARECLEIHEMTCKMYTGSMKFSLICSYQIV